MADPAPFDPASALSSMQGLLDQFGPSQADVAAASKARLFDIAAGLLGARRGFEFSALGQGLQKGQADYANMLKTLPAIRAANLQAVLPLAQMQMRMGMLNNFLGTLGAAQQPTTVAGPQQPFMQNQTNANAVAGNAPTSVQSLPTQQTVPAGSLDPSLRQRLAQANLGLSMFGVNATPALQFMFPQPVRVNQGGGVYDPASHSFNVIPKAPEGAQPVQGPDGQWHIELVPGALGAEGSITGTRAGATAVGGTMGKPPVETVNATGQKTLPRGTLYDQLYPSGNPFGLNVGGASGPANVSVAPLTTAAPAAPVPVPVRAGGAPAPSQGGASVTELSPEQEETSKNLADYEKAIHTAADAASVQEGRMNSMRELMTQFTPGATLPMRSDIARYALDVPGIGGPIANALVPHAATAIPAIQAFTKDTIQFAADQSRALGSREAAQIVQMLRDANPNIGMVPGAPQTVMQFMSGLNKYALDTESGLSAWKQAHSGTVAGFKEYWHATNPVTKYVPPLTALANIAAGKPPGIDFTTGAPSGASAPTQTAPAVPSFALTAKGRGNATLQALLKRETPNPQQLQILRLNGLIQ